MIAASESEARLICADVDARLRSALDYLAQDVLGLPAGDWNTGPAAHAAQAMMRDAATRDDVAAIRRIFTDNLATLRQPDAGGLRVLPFASPALSPGALQLLQYALSDDVGLTTALVAPSAAEVDRVGDMFARLRSGLREATPDWWAEFETLVRLVLLAESTDRSGGFGGASAFAAWGAVLVNPRAAPAPLDLSLTLVHESSHLKLFSAFVADEIVLNDPDERFASPLRVEPRPMNGIYHAAFVLARMIGFSADLLASGRAEAVLGPGQEAELRRRMLRSIGHFEAGHAEVAAHGRLTARGRDIIAEAAASVARVRALAGAP